MTTELEEQFFKTFGIEPIEYRKDVPCLNFLSSGICNITDERCNPSKCNEYRPDKTNRLWRDFMEVYPKITAEKLLEMICIMNKHIHKHNENALCPVAGENLEEVKNYMLRLFNFNQALLEKIFIQEIQQLFKEEE